MLVANEERCLRCEVRLGIRAGRHRFVETLKGLCHLVVKAKGCPDAGCPAAKRVYRPAEEGRFVLKGHEFGMDVLVFSGQRYLVDRVSVPRIHRQLRAEFGVPICERSVSNLVDEYVALCECVAGDEERVQRRLQEQGGIVLAVDGVHFDGRSPQVYVQRDVLSGEVLYGESRVAAGADDLAPMLKRVRDLAARLGIPVLGVVSDKERSLVPAIAEVFPGIPHQYCQTHYLSNLSRPLVAADQQLADGVQEVVYGLREIERTIERLDRERAGGDRVSIASTTSPTVAATASTSPQADQDDAALQGECDAALKLVLAGEAAGVVCGRPITDPAGLKRFQRLELVRAATLKAAERAKACADGWSLLQALLAVFSMLDALRPEALRLQRHLEMVRNIAHILGEVRPARAVKRRLRTYIDRILMEARRDADAATCHFVENIDAVSRRYWRGLFHTYLDPRIPSTTNTLESFFGSAKRRGRNISGRKAGGGKLQSIGAALIRVQALMHLLSEDQLAELLVNVPPESFATSKQRLSSMNVKARLRRSFQRDPKRYLEAALKEWLSSS